MLINPAAFRMRHRRRSTRMAQLIEGHGGRIYPASALDQMHGVLERILNDGVDRLVLAGGDGTLQGTVTYLACRVPPDHRPDLVVLGGGRTNFVARDLGTRDQLVATLKRVLAAEHLQANKRRTLCLRHPGLPEQHGFFVAGGYIDRIIRHIHAWRAARSGWLHEGRFATQFGLAALGMRRLLRANAPLPELTVDAGELGSLAGPVSLLLLTTLTHADGGLDPYAQRGSGEVRLTAIRKGASGFWTGLPAIARGRFSARHAPAAGFLSGRCDRVVIHNLPGISMDGQEFGLDPAVPLEITAGPNFNFLQP